MSTPNLNCVHRFITGEEAEEILKAEGKDGSFLIRPSSLNPDDLSLSVRRKDEIIHIRIQNTGEYYDLYGGEQFASLPKLIEYYTKGEGNNQLMEKNGKAISMKFPIPAPKHREERWFHANVTGSEAEEKLKSLNKEGTFLVRESVSKSGDFVLSCLVEGQGIVHVIIKKHKGKYTVGDGESFPSLSGLIDFYRTHPMTIRHGSDNSKVTFALQKSLIEGAVQISKLDLKIAELEKEFNDRVKARNGFWEEFEHIQQADTKEEAYAGLQIAGSLPENKKKNRYRNILPYDETRVKLKNVDQNVTGSDYINANYVSMKQMLPHIKKIYIATQGCVKATVGDFWNMVWQEKVSIIVMITELIENQKHKCEKYWPNQDKEMTFEMFSGKIVIREEGFSSKGDYVVRWFSVTQDNETRTVHHYQHLKWPDKCTPKDVLGSVDFVLDINNQAKEILLPDNSNWLIHCSAGIGRTGCFILIDIIINHIKCLKCKGLDATINIPNLLLMMRSQRAGLVQTEKQYTFVYKAIQSYVKKYVKGPVTAESPKFVYETIDDISRPVVPQKPNLQEEQLYENLRDTTNPRQ